MTWNRRVEAETLAPVLTDLPPVIVLCAGMWIDKTQRVEGETSPLAYLFVESLLPSTSFGTECSHRGF